MTDQLIPISEDTLAKVILSGDLTKLTDTERAQYVIKLCQRLNIDPMTQPFRLLKQQVPSPSGGKMDVVVLYATKNLTEQLTQKYSISTVLTPIEIKEINGEAICTSICKATIASNGIERCSSSLGAVSLTNLKGEGIANALMKCQTKATRRSILSLMGLGMIDETERETLSGKDEAINIVVEEGAVAALDADLAAEGGLTIGQRKECIAWMRLNAAAEIAAFIGSTGGPNEDEAQQELGEKGANCLVALKIINEPGEAFADKVELLEACCSAAVLDAEEKIRRDAAAASVKGKSVPKGGATAAAKAETGSTSSAAVGASTSPTEGKPVAASASTTSATTGGGQVSSASTAAKTGSPVTPAEAPAPNYRGTVPKLSEMNGSKPTTATKPPATAGASAKNAPAENPVGTEAQQYLAKLEAHLASVANKDEVLPTSENEGRMLTGVAKLNGWSDKQRGWVMANIFRVTGNKEDPQHPINFTWDAVADMGRYFAEFTPDEARKQKEAKNIPAE